MPIRDIPTRLERADARIERFERIEAVRERNRLIWRVIKMNVGIIALLCALYAIAAQFEI